jgi:hypothetical protein
MEGSMLPKRELEEMIQNTERVKAWVIWIVGLGLMASVFAVSAATYALEDQAGNKLTLLDQPCHVQFLKGWKKAEFRYEGKDLKACWIASQGVVYVIDDLGDLTPVPVAAFKRLSES